MLRENILGFSEKMQGRLQALRAAGHTTVKGAFQRAVEALRRAEDALGEGLWVEVVAVELREAIQALSLAGGVWLRHDALTESMLDRIFAGFCLGK